jgi:hypothetical protein
MIGHHLSCPRAFGGSFEQNFIDAVKVAQTHKNLLRTQHHTLFYQYFSNDESVISLSTVGNYNQITIVTPKSFQELANTITTSVNGKQKISLHITTSSANTPSHLPAGFYQRAPNTISFGMTEIIFLFKYLDTENRSITRKFSKTTMSTNSLKKIAKTLGNFIKEASEDIVVVGHEDSLLLSEIYEKDLVLVFANA